MHADHKIWLGRGDKDCYLHPAMANRHGLIAGASGTGKTITLKVLAESFSDMGVPVFLADIKGDLSGMCVPGQSSAALEKRLAHFGLTQFPYQAFPTCYWDVYGKGGHPVRTTISDMGPLLISRLMGLTDIQQSVLESVFRIADDQGLLLLDMKDLKAMLQHVSEHRKEYITDYGNMSPQSLGAVLRNVMVLEDNGGDIFFGEPALDIYDWMKNDVSGKGYINILDCTQLFLNPTLYATFMLWLLNELFERLPEAGDLDKPKLVFFFDEAHLLFDDMPKALMQKLEQVIKLIRSKGVGIYFITQSPSDIPDVVLAQLSNRVQHALRAYTPKEQKAVKVAAETFRPNPAFDTVTAITQLGTGEALVSTLDEEGRPSMVEKATIMPPQSLMGPVAAEVRADVMECSEMGPKYDQLLDRYSAYENLEQQNQLQAQREAQAAALAEQQKAAEAQRLAHEKEYAALQRQWAEEAAAAEREHQKQLRKLQEQQRKEEERKKKEMQKILTSAARGFSSSIGRELGKSIIRGLFGSRK